MKSLIFLASLFVLGSAMPGGWSDENANEPKWMAMVTKLQSKGLLLPMNGGETLIKVQTQVVSGMNYNFTFQRADTTTCYIVYYEQAWTDTHIISENTCSPSSTKQPKLAGGYTSQDVNDPKWMAMLSQLDSDSLVTLPVNQNNMELLGVSTQVVAGLNYKFNLKINGNNCQIVLYSIPWEKKQTVTEDNCSQLTSKRQLGGMPGGWSPVTDTSSVGLQSCLGQSLDRINSMSNSMYRLVDSQIINASQQVVSGMKYQFTIKVGESTCTNSGESMGFTSIKCPANANSMMTNVWKGECVYAAWQDPKTTILNLNMPSSDVDITAAGSTNGQLLGGDGHDQIVHGQGLLGGDNHDLVKHAKNLLGGDGHDLTKHGKALLGRDGHDLVEHAKSLLGGDGQAIIKQSKELLGGDTHDLVDHAKNLLGGDGHDLIKHGKDLLGSNNHDLVGLARNLLGGDGHDLIKHGRDFLRKEGQDLVQHGTKRLIGQDGHDNLSHGTASATPSNCNAMFQKFKMVHNKVYGSQKEESKRVNIFCNNMRRAKQFQSMDKGTARYGATKFADLTYTEFKQYMGLKWDPTAAKGMKKADIPKGPIPESFDWRDHGAVTPVKNQGSCGSCWAFSTTGNIEGQWAIKKGKLISLSEQELVDCDKVDEGCSGGLPSNAYKEIERLGGLETETEYSYKAEDEKCQFKKKDVKVYINDSVSISTNETEMAAWLASNGPISIGINAFAMQFYMGGISHPWKIFCNPSDLDHGVLIVGYGVQGNKPYWIVKNSWGPDWGEKGYYLVYRGAGVCGLNSMCTSSVVG